MCIPDADQTSTATYSIFFEMHTVPHRASTQTPAYILPVQSSLQRANLPPSQIPCIHEFARLMQCLRFDMPEDKKCVNQYAALKDCISRWKQK